MEPLYYVIEVYPVVDGKHQPAFVCASSKTLEAALVTRSFIQNAQIGFYSDTQTDIIPVYAMEGAL